MLVFFIFTRDLYSNEKSDYDWFWIIYENEITDNAESFAVRPFFLRNIKGENIFTASLMPVLFWEYENPYKTQWKAFFGFAESVDYVHNNGVRDYDFGVFPFFLYGDSIDSRDRYMHIWPFGGTVKGKLGQDRIKTVLFPGLALFYFFPPAFPPTLITAGILLLSFVPLYADYESRDYQAHAILWPLIQWGKSPTRNDKRFLPFYSHNYKKDTYDNYSLLMLFNYGRTILNNDEERTVFAFPFFGRRWNVSSSVRNSGTLLWPFFSWGYDLKRGDFELNFPWPLVQYQTSADPMIRKRIFFPFFGSYKYGNNETHFVTPLYFSLKKHTESFVSEYYINAFIIWYFKRDYKNKPDPVYGSSWRYFKIWPLFQYEYDDRGNLGFNLLSLLPLRDPEGYERLYQPFWTLLEYKRLESGEKRFGLLLRFYYQRWGADFMNIKIPLLLSYGSAENKYSKLSFTDYCSLLCYNTGKDRYYVSMVFSMFAYNKGTGGKYIRLFWIPISLDTDSGNEASVNTDIRGKGIVPDRDDDIIEDELDYYCDIYNLSDAEVPCDAVIGRVMF